jgi:hypothetical protein
LAAVGLTATSQFDFSVFAFDNYFTGMRTRSDLLAPFFDRPLVSGSYPRGRLGVPERRAAVATSRRGGSSSSRSGSGLAGSRRTLRRKRSEGSSFAADGDDD